MKRICICCDGTWNSADQATNGIPHPTNVLRTAYRIAKRDGPIDQLVYYDQGVGTGNRLDRLTGGAFGSGLIDNIYDAYRFLIANYEPDDEIYLFGFSRGAFTVRRLAGMIDKCGILKRASVAKYHEARSLYLSSSPVDSPRAKRFRQDHSLAGDAEIPIKFVGVWDTVGALGIPLRGLRLLTLQHDQFHDTQLSHGVKFAYQALAIDEHREPFAPTLWSPVHEPDQTIEQVWFCGAHSDVGGGYVGRGLADITLGWMIEKAQSHGLAFEDDVLAAFELHPAPLARVHNSMTGLYRLARRHDRVIGLETTRAGEPEVCAKEDPTQSIHESALQRWHNDASYRPASLRDYFRRANDMRAIEPPRHAGVGDADRSAQTVARPSLQ